MHASICLAQEHKTGIPQKICSIDRQTSEQQETRCSANKIIQNLCMQLGKKKEMGLFIDLAALFLRLLQAVLAVRWSILLQFALKKSGNHFFGGGDGVVSRQLHS